MKSLDVIRAELSRAFKEAVDNNDTEKMADALASYAEDFKDNLMKDYEAYQSTKDASILAQRGIHQLTKEEKEFWNAFKNAYKTGDIQASFTNIDKTYPQSFVVEVLDNIKKSFPLLDAIDFTTTTLATKILVNAQAAQFATWGAIGSAISTELSANVSELDLTACKLSAFIPLSMDMIEVGAEWLQSYVKGILTEAIGNGLCKAATSGTGKNEPAGMDRDISSFNSSTGYAQKTAVTVTSLGAAGIASLYAAVCKDGTGRPRKTNNALLVVNSATYYGKVFPALYNPYFGEIRTALPLNIIIEENVSDNKAIFGLGKSYKMGAVLGGKSGELSFSDDVQFLDDNRVYKSKVLGNGRPVDNVSFVFCDVSGLVPDKFDAVIEPTSTAVWNTKEVPASEDASET